MKKRCRIALIALGILAAGAALAGGTVDRVRATGQVGCGVVANPEDWNKTDLHGQLAALDGEMCKAVAIAVLGAKARVGIRVYDSELEAEAALGKGAVDVLMGVSPEATSSWHWNISFGPPFFYDGQAVLVRGDAAAKGLAELAGLKVCVVEGTDNEKILLARTVARGIAINPLPFQEEGEMDDGLAVRHCDAVSAYVTRLAQLQADVSEAAGPRSDPARPADTVAGGARVPA